MSKITIERAVLEQALAEMERHQIFKRFVESIAALREALAQPQPVQQPAAWSERIKELADQYAIECVEFSKGIPNGAHSMSPIAVKAGDTRLAFHSAIDTAERFIRAIESATLAAQVERATQPQPVQPLTEREIILLDGMIHVQLRHAEQCDSIGNRTMAEKQKSWDMERVELLRKLKDERRITKGTP